MSLLGYDVNCGALSDHFVCRLCMSDVGLILFKHSPNKNYTLFYAYCSTFNSSLAACAIKEYIYKVCVLFLEMR